MEPKQSIQIEVLTQPSPQLTTEDVRIALVRQHIDADYASDDVDVYEFSDDDGHENDAFVIHVFAGPLVSVPELEASLREYGGEYEVFHGPSCETCGEEIDVPISHLEKYCECPPEPCGRGGDECIHRPSFDCYGADECDECGLFLDPDAGEFGYDEYGELTVRLVCAGHPKPNEWPTEKASPLDLAPQRTYAGPVGVGFDTLAEVYGQKGPL